MRLILRYMGKYVWAVIGAMLVKLTGTFSELLIPYILEYMIDEVAPKEEIKLIVMWGVIMLALAVAVRTINVCANRWAVSITTKVVFNMRCDQFKRSIRLSGNQMDEFGLPSLTSRMTSDTYNVQNFVRSIQTLGIRAPILLIGGIIITMTMDVGLSMILCIMAPILIVIVVCISFKGIPLYEKVQQGVDDIVRVMREGITGIRVVKALSKEEHERERFNSYSDRLNKREIKAGIIMSLPGPIMSLTLNLGLTLVVLIGAIRVNNGATKPGVILAFLTYFNMILMGVMGLNRIFVMMSKANASANRIAEVIAQGEDLTAIPEDEAYQTDSDAFVSFEDVSFRYGQSKGERINTIEDEAEKKRKGRITEEDVNGQDCEADQKVDDFAGEERRMSLEHVSFSLKKGEMLGIIGPTGCGKTTIINLLMRFYDATEGKIFVDGRDIRTYSQDELHRKFGVVFQNDVVFADTLAENIAFGREVSKERMEAAAQDACAYEFIEGYDDKFEHEAAIHGANLSGGQRQRVLITRALAAKPEILILDDASSALDYKTDADLRKALARNYSETTTVIIAQRISSIMNADHILVMDEGRVIGSGRHEELMKNCSEYVDIYNTQMGEGTD